MLWEWKHGLLRLSGVLDRDDVELGDAAEDFAAVEASYDRGFLRRVLARDSRAEPGPATRAAGIRGTFALQQALHAVRDQDEEEPADGLADYR